MFVTEELSMNWRKGKPSAREDGTSCFKKILISRRILMLITFSSKDRGNNTSRLFTKMSENSLNPTREWPAWCNKKIRGLLPSIWSTRWEWLMRRSRPCCSTTKTSTDHLQSSNSNMTKWNVSYKISCALDPLIDRVSKRIPWWWIQLFKILKDWFRELKNWRT